MRFLFLIGVACTLAACNGSEIARVDGHERAGRYQGVGIYSPDEVWTQQVVASTQSDKADAILDDDGQVIVVVDSKTGEIRQCGNMSAHCTTMTPWGTASATKLKKHRVELRAEADAQDAQPARAEPEVAGKPAAN